MTTKTSAPLKKVLIANRGEIAVRIIRTLRELGISSVAVYSDADSRSLHRHMADYAVRLPGASSAETYLNVPRLLDAIERSGADGVHPGYGFLSENADFAEAVTKLGVKFIGPSARSMRLMGDKVQAKQLVIQNEVPVVPGSEGALGSLAELERLTETMGFPLILKASAGGGGRGMRVVRQPSELKAAFEACSREAQAYFGNPEVFAERYIENPRHIEIQVLCDAHGNGVHLFERDCSVQRRHQKLVEEAPSAFLSDAHRARLGEIAVRAALAAGYEGVGTVEFICESPERSYFMEMNTRIQVEHPVTEMITGIDLVAEQIKVARGEKLAFAQSDLRPEGWAIEVRINAEDPARGFVPAPGMIHNVVLPQGPYVRVDTHIYPGYEVPGNYDSMIAKVIVWGEDRARAIARMKRALTELRVEGVPTTARFHEAVLSHEEFCSGQFDTSFLEKNADALAAFMRGASAERSDASAILAAILAQESLARANVAIKRDERDNWRRAGLLEATRRS